MNAKKRRRRSLKKDERAVSPVIGVILMIAITVVIAAVVAAFAYGIIGGVTKAPNAALVVEDAAVGKTNITIIHHGGDPIVDAFKDDGTNGDPGDWSNLVVKHNGTDIKYANVTFGGDKDMNFESGEQMEIWVPALESGDSIAVVYTPSGDILQRVKVT